MECVLVMIVGSIIKEFLCELFLVFDYFFIVVDDWVYVEVYCFDIVDEDLDYYIISVWVGLFFVDLYGLVQSFRIIQ